MIVNGVCFQFFWSKMGNYQRKSDCFKLNSREILPYAFFMLYFFLSVLVRKSNEIQFGFGVE